MVPYSNPPSQYDWLRQDAVTVAKLLLSYELVSQIGGTETAGRIVETEAYCGEIDPASHAFRGPTLRTAPMFEAGGQIYVYLSYGIHTCMNIVAGPAGTAGAVLIRALEPSRGVDTMQIRRHTTNLWQLCSGPGKLTQALGIGLALSGSRLGAELSLRAITPGPIPETIIAGPRVGISRAKDLPWRFTIADNKFVSKR